MGHKIITITITRLSEASVNFLSEKFQHPVSGSNHHFPIFPMNNSTVHNHPGLHAWHCPQRVSPWFSQPLFWFFSSLNKSRCRLIQKQGGMLRWQKCHVDYLVGERRGKAHPEHIRSKWVRPGTDLSTVSGTLGHLPYPQH